MAASFLFLINLNIKNINSQIFNIWLNILVQLDCDFNQYLQIKKSKANVILSMRHPSALEKLL